LEVTDAMRDAIVGLLGLMFLSAVVVVIVQLVRRKWKSAGIWTGTAIAAIIIAAIIAPASSAVSPTLDAVSTPNAPTPKPTSYAQSVREQKRQFLSGVNESITGSMIEGNRYRYVGKKVDLHCTVETIPDQSAFNASCGEDEDGSPATIVVEYDTHNLSPGQSVCVLGTVDQPVEGSNAMGGDSTFPTVKAEFME
jgi:hypothetical protein